MRHCHPGFLGAGKSTLVRHILTAQHGRRIAVIVNEFGEELGIERAIVNEPEVLAGGSGNPAGPKIAHCMRRHFAVRQCWLLPCR